MSISLPAMVKTKAGKPVEPECTKGQIKDNSTKKEEESVSKINYTIEMKVSKKQTGLYMGSGETLLPSPLIAVSHRPIQSRV